MKRIVLLFAAAACSLMSASAQQNVSSGKMPDRQYKSVRLSVQGGYAYRTSKVNRSGKLLYGDYAEKMKEGISYGADATWYFSKSFGVGIKYSAFRSDTPTDYMSITNIDESQNQEGSESPSWQTISGRVENHVSIWFLGPLVSYRLITRNMRHSFIMDIGIGYMGYKDNVIRINPYVRKGGSPGFVYEIGYDFNISRTVAVGAMATYGFGIMSKYRTKLSDGWHNTTLERGFRENLNHVNLSVGLRIYL